MTDQNTSFTVDNVTYNIVAVLHSLLESEDLLATYASDAEQQGDQECATIFRTLRENNRSTSEQLVKALGRHLGGGR